MTQEQTITERSPKKQFTQNILHYRTNATVILQKLDHKTQWVLVKFCCCHFSYNSLLTTLSCHNLLLHFIGYMIFDKNPCAKNGSWFRAPQQVSLNYLTYDVFNCPLSACSLCSRSFVSFFQVPCLFQALLNFVLIGSNLLSLR